MKNENINKEKIMLEKIELEKTLRENVKNILKFTIYFNRKF